MICIGYVDDGIIAGQTEALVDAAFTIIANAFEVRDTGESITSLVDVRILGSSISYMYCMAM